VLYPLSYEGEGPKCSGYHNAHATSPIRDDTRPDLALRTRSPRVPRARESDFTAATPRAAGQQHRIPTFESELRRNFEPY
jgi:hypothetical protein